MTILPVGASSLAASGVASKAARLEAAVAAELPVPLSSVVPDGADAAAAAAKLAARHRRPVAVRSAFAAEDRADVSLAGHFDSFLNVEPTVDTLANAIESVRASGSGEYRRDVLVMDMVDATVAGVAFSEPGWVDDLVNFSRGLADKLLSGDDPGESLELDRLSRKRDAEPWQGRLAVLLKDVREVYGDEAWDIEFADDGSVCWLVQIRPITSRPVRNEWFTLANHREILPDPPSVFMTSLIEYAAPNLRGPTGIMSSTAEGRRLIEVFDRRPYLNLSLLSDFLRRIGLPTSLVADSLGGADGVDVPADPMLIARGIPTLAKLGLQQVGAARQANKAAARLAKIASDTTMRFGPIIEQAAKTYVALVDEMGSLATAMAVPVQVIGKVGTLDYHVRKQRTEATRMLDGMNELADLVRGDAVAQEHLAAGVVPDVAGFAFRWKQWLRDHGQRGVFESDFSRPRYSEDASSVLLTISRLATAPPMQRGDERPKRALLTTPLWLFARMPMQAREALRDDAMRAFGQHRADLLRVAEQAADRGQIPNAEDIWMLTIDELRTIDDGQVFDAAFVGERCEDFDRAAAIVAPDIRRRFGAPGDIDGDSPRMQGLPLTGGTVTGIALVLAEPVADITSVLGDVVDGDIVLVAQSVDAGWVPLFGQVDGVAVDIGGDLSHGSIVLRELGLPAITNTRRGTITISTGDRVRLDASAGTIELLDATSARR